MHRAILANQPIEQWRFETVRARYLALLKRAGHDPAVEETSGCGWRGSRGTSRPRRPPDDADDPGREPSPRPGGRPGEAPNRGGARSPDSGLSTPWASCSPRPRGSTAGKLYVLIAKNGSTVAYLDIPPGLDPDPLVAHRVGVRGVPHYNEDLGTRLITVHDIESIEATR